MLITDPTIADELVQVTPRRCLVLAARETYAAMGTRLTSQYECCACAMPATRHDQTCEMCGSPNFRPARKETIHADHL